MANTMGNFCPVIVSWAYGRLLDYFGDSIECWTGIMLSFALMSVVYVIVYILFCDSTPVNVSTSKNQEEKLARHNKQTNSKG